MKNTKYGPSVKHDLSAEYATTANPVMDDLYVVLFDGTVWGPKALWDELPSSEKREIIRDSMGL